ncbi:hypothetical protein D3C84_590890 [compost metagenome]
MQQLTQRFFRGDIAVHRGCLLAGHQIRAEEHLKRSLLAQLAQGLSQGLRRNVDRFARVGLRQRNVDGQRKDQGQPGGFVIFSGGFLHVERSPVDRKSVRLLMQTSCS